MERIASFIKNNVNCTKNELLEFNKENRILVNGQKVSLQYKLKETDIVTFDGKEIERLPYVYYAYNKPIGVICTNDINVNSNIKNTLNINQRVFTIGRLDKESHGLILLTNDGVFCHNILENANITKEYVVNVEKDITDEFIEAISKSINIKGKDTIPAEVYKITDKSFNIILRDGRYHQIRRLVQSANNKVIDLYRIRIGKFSINNLNGEEILKIDNLKELI